MTPWTQPELLKAWFKPIKNRVETHCGGVTLLKSASNLKQFIKKPIDGEYDVVQMPVQIGMYLMDIYNFKPVMIVHGKGHHHTKVLLVSLIRNNIRTIK